MTIEVHAPNASAVSRVFDPKRTLKALIKAANMTGVDLRKEIPAILSEEVQTSRAALQPKAKAKAAHSSQRDPAYTLRIARRIPLNKLKPSPACSSGAGASLEGDSYFDRRMAPATSSTPSPSARAATAD